MSCFVLFLTSTTCSHQPPPISFSVFENANTLTAPYLDREAVLANITQTLRDLGKETSQSLSERQESLNSLANVVLSNQMALDYLLASEGRVCAVTNTSCCMYINNSHQLQLRDEKTWEKVGWTKELHHDLLSSGSTSTWGPWLLSILSHILTPLLIIFFLVLFGPCTLNLLAQLVSSRLASINFQMTLQDKCQQTLECPVKIVHPLDAAPVQFISILPLPSGTH